MKNQTWWAGLILLAVVFGGADSGAAQRPGLRVRRPDELKAEYLAYLTPLARDLMAQWQAAWEGDSPGMARFYSEDATLTVPGEDTRRDEGGPGAYLSSVTAAVSGIQIGLAEIDGSEDLGFLFGRYDLTGIASPNGQPRDQGHHATLIKKEGREWRIRSQTFISSPTGDPGLWWQSDPAHPLAPLVGGGLSPGTGTAVGLTVSRLSQAWQEGDTAAIREHFTDDVVFRAPTGQAVSGWEETRALLAGGTVGFGSPLFMVAVDGESSGTMAFQIGRFVLEIPGVPAGLTSGPVVLVFREDWDKWKVRALVFAPPGV